MITRNHSIWPNMWLSGTEGDKNLKLGTLSNWPDNEIVDNVKERLEAKENVWRDFYTGQRLQNWTKDYFSRASNETTQNCMTAFSKNLEEWQCQWPFGQSCPCTYSTQPLLTLRGLCKDSLIEKVSVEKRFTLKQMDANPENMVLLGMVSARIEYNESGSKWIMTEKKYKASLNPLRATSRAPKVSYVLGKHNWTISNDAYECNEGQAYNTTLKLTGCKEDEFTCDDGQCVKMTRRCDQVTGKEPNCRDESDEGRC